jgi:hypothetical protein
MICIIALVLLWVLCIGLHKASTAAASAMTEFSFRAWLKRKRK